MLFHDYPDYYCTRDMICIVHPPNNPPSQRTGPPTPLRATALLRLALLGYAGKRREAPAKLASRRALRSKSQPVGGDWKPTGAPMSLTMMAANPHGGVAVPTIQGSERAIEKV
jgi:hypothetical protein